MSHIPIGLFIQAFSLTLISYFSNNIVEINKNDQKYNKIYLYVGILCLTFVFLFGLSIFHIDKPSLEGKWYILYIVSYFMMIVSSILCGIYFSDISNKEKDNYNIRWWSLSISILTFFIIIFCLVFGQKLYF